MDERVSYCLLFFALLTSAHCQGSIRGMVQALPISDKARKLAAVLVP